MIENNTQLKSSKNAIKMLKKSLKAPVKKGIPKEIENAARGHIAEFIKEIENEISIYETQIPPSPPLPLKSPLEMIKFGFGDGCYFPIKKIKKKSNKKCQ